MPVALSTRTWKVLVALETFTHGVFERNRMFQTIEKEEGVSDILSIGGLSMRGYMGRKRKRDSLTLENEDEIIVDEQIPSKKKSKKLKRKKSKIEDDETTPPFPDETPPPSTVRPLTLKIKLGTGEVLTTTSTDTKSNDQLSLDTGSIKSSSNLGDEWATVSDDVSLGGESYALSGQEEDEEEAWLNALESGLVNERGYLPQSKDPSSMTVRQRAMLGSKEEELLELPLMKLKSEEIESEEMLLKKTERNKKRRLQAIKRREKHKAETVQKLLHKQSTKKKDDDKKVVHQAVGPHLRYHSNLTNGTTLSVTDRLDFPLSPQKPHPIPPPKPRCVICGEDKRYNDSKTHSPLCSMECYNKLHNKTSSHQTNTLLVTNVT